MKFFCIYLIRIKF